MKLRQRKLSRLTLRKRLRRWALRQRQPSIHSGGNQILPQLVHGRELQGANAEAPRGFDILELVVQEECLLGSGAQLIQEQVIDLGLRLSHAMLVAPDQDVKILDP